MKHPLFWAALLAIWIIGSSYWYVCKIRCDCRSFHLTEEGIQVAGDDGFPATGAGTQAETETDAAETALQKSLDDARAMLASEGVQEAFFATGASRPDMSGVSSQYLQSLILILENNPDARVALTGHTDSSGTDEVNLALGLQRAEEVKAFLVEAGIDPGQIITASRGESQPAASNDTPDGRAANRRVEINLIS